MRPTLRYTTSRARRGVLAFALFALLAATGCHGPGHHHGGRHGFTSDTSPIQVVTTELGGKNVFIPSTIVVTSGHPVKLTIFNTTDVPHGFAIPAIDVAIVLPPKAEQELEIPKEKLQDHQILQIKCHLHEKHRTATLVVLPGREER
jgi:heme/copper-type cytochrome/quinol oxidase subunit 2